MTQIQTYGNRISCYNHTKFHTTPLHGYGEIPSNISPHKRTCMADNLYRTCTLAWGDTLCSFYSSKENGMTLKQAPFCSFKRGLCMISILQRFGDVTVSSKFGEKKTKVVAL